MAAVIALLFGVIAGLRTMTAPAAVSWAAATGVIDLSSGPLAFLGWRYTPWILTLLATAELVTDQLPMTPSRKVPLQFGARIVSGALCGAAIGLATSSAIAGLVAGVVGALIGTLAGAAFRARLAVHFGRDRPGALIEDAVAIAGAALLVWWLRLSMTP